MSIFNELHNPRMRKPAMMINSCCLSQCDALVVIGTRISPGMREEIDMAKTLGLPIFSLGKFKKLLSNLPMPPQTLEEKKEFAIKVFKSIPSETIAEKVFSRKRNKK